MIRNVVVGPMALLLRALVRAALAVLQVGTSWLPRPAWRRAVLRIGAALLEVPVEYALFLVGWVAWGIDWLVRWPSLELATRGRLGRGVVRVHGVLLTSTDRADAERMAKARAALAAASSLLEPHGMILEWSGISVLEDPGLRLPAGGPRGLVERFFTWASARVSGPSPRVTVYFADNLSPLAGCAVPGADWFIVDLGADGSTLVHEMGHLADLWRHSEDPDNVMTDRQGGAHACLTPRQAAMLRSSRFVSRLG